MAEWLRFSVCFWHTFRGKGSGQSAVATAITATTLGCNAIQLAMATHFTVTPFVWPRAAACTPDPFGAPTIRRSWDDESASLANAKRRLRAAFELMTKLGVRHWTFHDRDIAPEGKDLAETNANLDEIVDLAL